MTTAVIPLDDLPRHMERVHARATHHDSPAGRATMRAKLDDIGARLDTAELTRCVVKATTAPSVTARVHWLRKAADLYVDAAGPLTPCTRGCSHCCHIGVLIPENEAELIARQTGRTLHRPKNPVPDMSGLREQAKHRTITKQEVAQVCEEQRLAALARYHGQPCTFLGTKGECTIYEHRPFICRTVINMDSDALLCRLLPVEMDATVKVPYLNLGSLQELHATATDTRADGGDLADVREWFPR